MTVRPLPAEPDARPASLLVFGTSPATAEVLRVRSPRRLTSIRRNWVRASATLERGTTDRRAA